MGELFLALSIAKAGKSSRPSTTTQLASRGWEERRHSPPWRKFEVLQPCVLQNHSERRRAPCSLVFAGSPSVARPRRFGEAAVVAAIGGGPIRSLRRSCCVPLLRLKIAASSAAALPMTLRDCVQAITRRKMMGGEGERKLDEET